jgi:hypothetical protein
MTYDFFTKKRLFCVFSKANKSSYKLDLFEIFLSDFKAKGLIEIHGSKITIKKTEELEMMLN